MSLRHPSFLTSLLLLAPVAFAQTRACAHRGDVEHFPENTLPALASAAAKRAPQIEFDVKHSRDRQLVILHDSTLQRTSNGSGKLAGLTLPELLRLDFGAWFAPAFAGTRIPTLREVVAAIPPDLLLNVHLDAADPSVAVPAATLIAQMGRLQSAIFAATVEQAAELRRRFPAIRICNMSRQGGDLNAYVESTIAMHAEFIQLRDAPGGSIPEGLESAIARLHRNQIKVNYFGANDEAKLRSLAAAGVDYVLTDKLDLCLRVLAETSRR
jgi:glycerophosphoryl diester phosphodiesterase